MKNIWYFLGFLFSIAIWVLGMCIIIVVHFIFRTWQSLWLKMERNTRSFVRMMPHEYRKFISIYDDMGLRWNLKYVESIQREIVFWPALEQMKFADRMTIKMCNKIKEEDIVQMFDQSNKEGLANLNATAIGNIAYLMIRHPEEGVRMKCYLYLDNVKDYFKLFKKQGE